MTHRHGVTNALLQLVTRLYRSSDRSDSYYKVGKKLLDKKNQRIARSWQWLSLYCSVLLSLYMFFFVCKLIGLNKNLEKKTANKWIFYLLKIKCLFKCGLGKGKRLSTACYSIDIIVCQSWSLGCNDWTAHTTVTDSGSSSDQMIMSVKPLLRSTI